MLIAKPLITLDKVRKITTKTINNKTYLFITPKKYIGVGEDLKSAINDANLRTFYTGYRVEEQ